ncbi:CinA family protein [Beggiatoa alba]|nr:CinA family protein [Beggiatoa alba]
MKTVQNFSKTKQIGRILTNRGWYIACAESCTGGWLAKSLTDVAGSSGWFERGYVTYSNRAKQEMLGVLLVSLDRFGAVSETVVKQMATGVCINAKTEVSLAISGIAGPAGGSNETPVGLVWFAWSINGQLETYSEVFAGDREAIRQQAVDLGIDKLLGYLETV